MNRPTDSTIVRKLGRQAFLLNAPFSLETRVANNATMQKLGAQARRVDRPRMLRQWESLYSYIAARSLVYLLPSREGLQDQTFVANLGIVPPHGRSPLVLISKFRAPARGGESAVGADFFRSMGFHVEQCPAFFEGEADLKPLRGNIYFGGYGLRSSQKAHAWMEEKHGFKIIPILLKDPHLYHLDCVLHVLGPQRVLLAADAVSAETLGAIGRVAEIIDVPLPLAYRGCTNVARLEGEILCDSNLNTLKKNEVLYAIEKAKVAFWERLSNPLNLQPAFFNLSEFYKSGAMLSCLVLPLNYPHLRKAGA